MVFKSHSEKSSFDLEMLRRLLIEGEKLPFRCSEVNQLRTLLHETDSWTKASRGYVQYSGMHMLLGQPKQALHYPPSTAAITSSPTGNNINNNNKTANLWPPSPSLEELSELLWRAQANPLYLPEKKALEELYDKALVFIRRVEEMIDANSNARQKKSR